MERAKMVGLEMVMEGKEKMEKGEVEGRAMRRKVVVEERAMEGGGAVEGREIEVKGAKGIHLVGKMEESTLRSPKSSAIPSDFHIR